MTAQILDLNKRLELKKEVDHDERTAHKLFTFNNLAAKIVKGTLDPKWVEYHNGRPDAPDLAVIELKMKNGDSAVMVTEDYDWSTNNVFVAFRILQENVYEE